ncbi:MAG: glycoside hydrolase family 57 protein [Meiothermus sp.]|nr:glycoside hydrolase family 57 protein [Meiothermus sp.]
MNLWHLYPDTPRTPRRVSPGERVMLTIGTWPIEVGQAVGVEYRVADLPPQTVAARWQRNQGHNSYWQAELGPFAKGDEVRYRVVGTFPGGEAAGPQTGFKVGPKLYLALLWHQHQPLYKDSAQESPKGSYLQPWVRLHALRDYYPMAALAAQHPEVHLTFNLTPVLLWQLEDYLLRGATDRALELTSTPAEALTDEERAYLLERFFDADWHHQIYPHPRYKELLEQRANQAAFSAQDLRDLQMWFNLSWFGLEFREGEVALVTGERASVRRWVEQDRGFSHDDLEAMIAEQYKVMRAVVPLHRKLQDRGQLEVSTTPFYHPILPLLADSDRATLDRPGATLPRRFAYPQDALAQVEQAISDYTRYFGQPPRGMWPAEGAVAQYVVPLFAGAGVRWIATDQGVLARSGRYGYDPCDPEVLAQPYRAEEGEYALSVFFRDTPLSDNIGFRYQGCKDFLPVARAFLDEIKGRFARRFRDDQDRVLSVILDGENAWGGLLRGRAALPARALRAAGGGHRGADCDLRRVPGGQPRPWHRPAPDRRSGQGLRPLRRLLD